MAILHEWHILLPQTNGHKLENQCATKDEEGRQRVNPTKRKNAVNIPPHVFCSPVHLFKLCFGYNGGTCHLLYHPVSGNFGRN